MAARDRFKVAKSIENDYYGLIFKLVAPLVDKALPYSDDLEAMKRAMRVESMKPAYQRHARESVKEMATLVNNESMRDWRGLIRYKTKSAELRRLLESEINTNLKRRMQELIETNSNLLWYMPENLVNACIRHSATEAMQGRRASEIAEEIERFLPNHFRSYARTLARTEVSRASSALTQARAEDLGIDWYEWRTSEDASVRSSHRIMDRVLIPYKHAPIPEKLDKRNKVKAVPAPYHAGNYYNCRCYQAPLVDINDVPWPHKVYDWKQGRIVRMTLNQFRKYADIKEVE